LGEQNGSIVDDDDVRKPERSLRIVIAASVLSKVADWQLGIVVPLAVLATTGSVALTLVSFALRLVPFAASPIIGSIIDRHDTRTVFVWAQVMQALCMVGIAMPQGSHLAVGVLLFVSGFGGVFVSVTGQFVLIPKLIHPDRQASAVARLSGAIEFSKVVGLVLGGLFVAVRGPRFAVWVIAGLYLGAGLVTLLLHRIPVTGARTTLRQDLAIGLRWVTKPDIIWLVVTMSAVNLAVGDLETVLVAIFGDGGMPAFVISLVLALGLFFGAVGSRISPHVLPSWTAERRILLFQVLALAGMGVVALPQTVVTVIGYAWISFAVGGSNVASIIYRQRAIPVDYAGRVNATIRMFITGAIPLSGFLYAWASAQLPDGWFWIPALVIATSAVLVWAAYTRRVDRGRPAVSASTGSPGH
jgi:predicted MFS family arabinose efflux permease